MRLHVIATIALLSLAAPVVAQGDPDPNDRAQEDLAPEDEDGLSLMERGARMLMEGMLQEMEPALEGLEELGPMARNFAREMGPALSELFREVKDWSVYHPPELLPNGDIIIRRKDPESTPDDPDAAPEPPEESDPIDI